MNNPRYNKMFHKNVSDICQSCDGRGRRLIWIQGVIQTLIFFEPLLLLGESSPFKKV